jgi:hypothetical protein
MMRAVDEFDSLSVHWNSDIPLVWLVGGSRQLRFFT